MEKEEKLAAIAGNLDKTQVVSLKDLEELEYLQLVGKDKTQAAGRSRTAVPLGAALGLLAAVLLAAVLAVVLVHHLAHPAAAIPSAAPQGSR